MATWVAVWEETWVVVEEEVMAAVTVAAVVLADLTAEDSVVAVVALVETTWEAAVAEVVEDSDQVMAPRAAAEK